MHLPYPITFDTWVCAKCGRKLTSTQLKEECDHATDGSKKLPEVRNDPTADGLERSASDNPL